MTNTKLAQCSLVTISMLPMLEIRGLWYQKLEKQPFFLRIINQIEVTSEKELKMLKQYVVAEPEIQDQEADDALIKKQCWKLLPRKCGKRSLVLRVLFQQLQVRVVHRSNSETLPHRSWLTPLPSLVQKAHGVDFGTLEKKLFRIIKEQQQQLWCDTSGGVLEAYNEQIWGLLVTGT